jgi:D-alanyl-D-alanine carboxypeptidase (penicillin-binding protein 5/6)
MKKFLLSFVLVISFITPSLAMETSAKQAVIIDMGTGMTLMSKNADAQMPTSSMSKVMTAYMVFDALKQERIQMDTTFPVSEKAWQKGGSKMFIEVGKSIPVEDLLKGLIIQSGNDAAIALAEGLSGDEEVFARVMTAKAKQLGMANTNLVNASGWPDPDHYSTANDLAILAQRLIVDFPHEYTLYGIKEFTYNEITQPNRNPLLYRDMGVDGIKTGHTEAAGYGLMASGEKDGRRVVMVVNGLDSSRDRANESARLMSWALNGFENIDLMKVGDIVAKAETKLGKQEVLPLTVNRDIRVTVPKGQRDEIKVVAEFEGPITAPVQKGTTIGTLNISVPQIGDFKVPLVAAESVEQVGFVGRTIHKLKSMVMGE